MSALSLNLDTRDLARQYEINSVDRQFAAGKRLVQRLGVAPGENVLDVGCGTGLLAEHVASLVGPKGSVVGIDPLKLRIEIAERRTKSNLIFRVGDAHDLSAIADQTFDVVILNEVFHWLIDKQTALREAYRVLKGTGRLGIATGSVDHPNTVQEIRKEVLSRDEFRRFPEARAGVAQWVSQSDLQALLANAGFVTRTVEMLSTPMNHRTADEAIEFLQASSFGNFLGHLPEAVRTRAREAIKRELDRLRREDGFIQQESLRMIAIAVKPAV